MRSRPVTEPVGRTNTLAEVLSELGPLDEEFPDIEDLPSKAKDSLSIWPTQGNDDE